MLFYGLFPVNSLLTILTTKDILFAAFVLVFFIDSLQFLQNECFYTYLYYYDDYENIKREPVKSTLLLFVLTFLIFFGANKALTLI